MAGPTPTSALIHAATMVTAGVYLLARMDGLMAIAPPVRTATAAIGAAGLVLAALAALAQRDIKKVLAYSTMSQVGYMFLALGVGSAWSAIYHFMTHAAFKSLLFLGAGAVILAMGHQQDVSRMGGLRRRMPLVFWTFLVGVLALSAFPLVTSGDYSKDDMLEAAWTLGTAWGKFLWTVGAVGAVISALYSFRLLFLVFCGESREKGSAAPDWAGHDVPRIGWSMTLPMVVLAVATVAIALVQLPGWIWEDHWLSNFLQGTFKVEPMFASPKVDFTLLGLTGVASLIGLAGAWWSWRRQLARGFDRSSAGGALARLAAAGWGFDWAYDVIFVRPLVAAARAMRGDWIDYVWRGRRRSNGGPFCLRGDGNGQGALVRAGDRGRRDRDHCDGGAEMMLLWLLCNSDGGGRGGDCRPRRQGPAPARWICAIAMLAELAVCAFAWSCAAPGSPEVAPRIDLPWLPMAGVRFLLSMDGLSLVMVTLAAGMGFMSVLAAWRSAQTDSRMDRREGLFYFLLMWMVAGAVGIFLAMDLVLFYLFWEMMVIPLYFLVAIFGGHAGDDGQAGRADSGESSRAAATKMFVFTQIGGLLMLAASVALAMAHFSAGGAGWTFSFFELSGGERTGPWLMLGLVAAFAVKLPVVGLHTWLVDTHAQRRSRARWTYPAWCSKSGRTG